MERKPRKSLHADQTRVIDGDLYFEDVRQASFGSELACDILDDKHLRALRIISLSSHWIERTQIAPGAQLKTDLNVEMTLRKERFGRLDQWYAYRRVFGKLHKRYVGHTDQLTEALIVEVAQRLPGI